MAAIAGQEELYAVVDLPLSCTFHPKSSEARASHVRQLGVELRAEEVLRCEVEAERV